METTDTVEPPRAHLHFFAERRNAGPVAPRAMANEGVENEIFPFFGLKLHDDLTVKLIKKTGHYSYIQIDTSRSK